MFYKIEEVALSFYHDLGQLIHLRLPYVLENDLQPPVLKIIGEGAWRCEAGFGSRECTIYCHENEFSIDFYENSTEIADGRTEDKQKALASVMNWLDGCSLMELYQNYAFIDELKRLHEYIHTTLFKECGELSRCEVVNDAEWTDSYSLRFKERSVNYWVDIKEGFSFQFYWYDHPVMLAHNLKLEPFAELIKNWLVDELAISKLKEIYPWIEIYKIAYYYEKGELLLGDFIESWDDAENFYFQYSQYSQSKFTNNEKILDFIRALRQGGYDQILRAGTQVWTFIVSRARYNGLTEGQPFIRFSFLDDRLTMSVNDKDEFVFEEFKVNDEIIAQIQNLSMEPITIA